MFRGWPARAGQQRPTASKRKADMSTSLVLEPPPRPSSDTVDHALYVNRELSWLAFNERVLNEALNPAWPLLERVKFLAIYSSNLDEFFMIRVSGLHEQLEAALIDTTPDGLSPRDQLTRIGHIVRQQGEVAAALLSGDLLPALAGKQIHVRDWKDLTPEMQEAAR